MNKPSIGTASSSSSSSASSAQTGQDSSAAGAAPDPSKLVGQAKQAVTHVVGDVADRAKEQVNTEFDSRKDKAVETMDNVAHALRETGSKLKGVGPLADVAGQAANGVEKVADFFDGKHVGDLVRDAEKFARREPALFIGAAFAIGLIGGRFLKSSAHRSENDGAGVQVSRGGSGSGSSMPRSTPPKRFSAQSSSGGSGGGSGSV